MPGTRILPRAVPDAFATGRFNRVPLLHGTNRDEGTFLVLAVLGSLRLTPETYALALANRYGADAPAVAAAYPAANYPTPTNALAATITDSVFACPAIEADRQARRYTPVHAYEFNDRDAPPMLPADIPLGAYHAAELQYVFQYTPALEPGPGVHRRAVGAVGGDGHVLDRLREARDAERPRLGAVAVRAQREAAVAGSGRAEAVVLQGVRGRPPVRPLAVDRLSRNTRRPGRDGFAPSRPGRVSVPGLPGHPRPLRTALISSPFVVSPESSQKKAPPRPWLLAYDIFPAIVPGVS